MDEYIAASCSQGFNSGRKLTQPIRILWDWDKIYSCFSQDIKKNIKQLLLRRERVPRRRFGHKNMMSRLWVREHLCQYQLVYDAHKQIVSRTLDNGLVCKIIAQELSFFLTIAEAKCLFGVKSEMNLLLFHYGFGKGNIRPWGWRRSDGREFGNFGSRQCNLSNWKPFFFSLSEANPATSWFYFISKSTRWSDAVSDLWSLIFQHVCRNASQPSSYNRTKGFTNMALNPQIRSRSEWLSWGGGAAAGGDHQLTFMVFN